MCFNNGCCTLISAQYDMIDEFGVCHIPYG